MYGEPQPQHEWLKQLLGDWTFTSQCVTGPDKPPESFAGRESVRALGPFWVIADGEGEMPGGGTGQMRLTLGFDPAKGYVGTWLGSMMPTLWVYAGTMSEDGRTLTLAAEGPNFSGEGTARYEDMIGIVSENERTLTSRMLGEDGEWREFVWVTYKRI